GGPAAAALALRAVLSVGLLFGGVGSVLQVQETRQQRKRAEEAQQRAEEQAELARHYLYINRIMRAHFEWQNNAVARADLQLDLCPPRFRHWEWHYVKRLCHSDRLTLRGHTAAVASVAFSPAGQRVCSGSRARQLKVWEAPTGR